MGGLVQATSGVYRITNSVNGKFYIGSSKNIVVRWRQHRLGAVYAGRDGFTSPLYYAFRKYGLHRFYFEILEEVALDKQELLDREQHYIDTLKPEYNISPVAGSSLGVKMSAEAKRKM